MTQSLWEPKPFDFTGKSPYETKPQESASQGLLIPGDYRGGRHFQPIVVMLYGRRGAGKTATMTALGAWFQQHYKNTGTPVHIAANYKVDFARYCSPYLIDELGDFPEWGQRLIVLIDEISTYTASERATSRATLDIGIFLTQVRKRDVEIIFCTQFPQEISRRVLRQVDIFIEVEQYNWNKDSKLYCHDYWGQWTGGWSRKPWPPTKEEADWELDVYNVDKIWNLYNTKEVIAPVWSEQRDGIIGQNWGEYEIVDESDTELATMPAVTDSAPTAPSFVAAFYRRAHAESDKSLNLNTGSFVRTAQEEFPDIDAPALASYLEGFGWKITRKSNQYHAKAPDGDDFI